MGEIKHDAIIGAAHAALEAILEAARVGRTEGHVAIDSAAEVVRDAIDGAHSDGRWSTTPPTEPGVYWMRADGAVVCVRVTENRFIEFHGAEEVNMIREGLDAEWWSERVEPPR